LIHGGDHPDLKRIPYRALPNACGAVCAKSRTLRRYGPLSSELRLAIAASAARPEAPGRAAPVLGERGFWANLEHGSMTPDNQSLLTPQQLIASIRTDDYLIGIVDPSDQLRKGLQSVHKKMGTMVKLLSEDLYAKETHFVLELIQNADDNSYAPDVTPHLKFVVTAHELLIENNEIGFEPKHVRALCNVGASSKTRKTGYIGEKGIGFKSVFTVSDTPEIHSNNFHFRFNSKGELDLLGYIVPEWIGPNRQVRDDGTTIVLPAKSGHRFDDEDFSDIRPEVTLFLSKLRQISIESQSRSVRFRRQDGDNESTLTSEIESAGAPIRVETGIYVRYSRALAMGEIIEEKRPDISETDLVLAFPISESGEASPKSDSAVFAFLPIRPFGFRFLIQADFILTASREDIHQNREWNLRLRDAIATTFVDAIETFKTRRLLARTYLRFLPADEVVDPFFKHVGDEILAKLSQVESVLSASGEWRRPQDLRHGWKEFQRLIPPETARQLFGFDYVAEDFEATGENLIRLGVKPVTHEHVVALFRDHGDWIKRQSAEWMAEWYAYVLTLDVSALLNAGLAKQPFVLTSAGEMASPSAGKVYFPLSESKVYGFEDELSVLSPALWESLQAKSAVAEKHLTLLGVSKPNARTLIDGHIVSRHKNITTAPLTLKGICGHVRYLKDNLDAYLEASRLNGVTAEACISGLATALHVVTKKQTDGVHIISKPASLYLGKEYGPELDIERLLGREAEPQLFVDIMHLPDPAQASDAELEGWRRFFYRLGVKATPKLVKQSYSNNIESSPELKKLLSSTKPSHRKAVLEAIDKNWSLYKDHLQYTSTYRRQLFVHSTGFANDLRAMLAPTRSGVVPIVDSYYPTDELKVVLGPDVAYVTARIENEGLLDACGISYTVDAAACIKRLKQLRDGDPCTQRQLKAIYRKLEELSAEQGLLIRQAFQNDRLIKPSGRAKEWKLATEVTWRPTSDFLDALYPPLQASYADFSEFFVKSLGIPMELPTGKRVAALTQLSAIADEAAREKEVLAIYRRANRDIVAAAEKGEEEPDWLSVFREAPALITEQGELRQLEESVYVNDDPSVAQLFADDPGIHFLGISQQVLPRLEPLIAAIRVPRVSHAVKRRISAVENPTTDPKLTQRLRGQTARIARLFYSKSAARLESSIRSGRFTWLSQLTVKVADDIEAELTLDGVLRTTSTDAFFADDVLVIRRGAGSTYFLAAREVVSALGAPQEMIDGTSVLLRSSDPEEAEQELLARRVGPLPDDIAEAISSGDGHLLQDDLASDPGHDAGGGRPAPDAGHVGDIDADAETDTQPSVAITEEKAGVVTPPIEEMGRIDTAPKVATAPDNSSGTESSPPIRAEQPHVSVPINRGEASKNTPTPSHSERSPRTQRSKTGRLLSYAEPVDGQRERESAGGGDEDSRNEVGDAAVGYFVATFGNRWQSVQVMPPNNKGFDVKGINADGEEEYIEVKGQSGPWSEYGVPLTPSELLAAHEHGPRFWLCVVEYVKDESRRSAFIVQDPFGSTSQFRFDSGWKQLATVSTTAALKPEAGLSISITDLGAGKIVSVRKKGAFFKLHVRLNNGEQVHRLFNAATMRLFRD